MFQYNPIFRRNFLRVGAISALTSLPLTYLIGGTLYARYILVAITSIGMFVLIVWLLDIAKNKFPPKKGKEKRKIAILTVLLFLSIQYFLVGILGELIYINKEQSAMEYCELVGRKAEEYKTLNGDYPSLINLPALDEIHRPRLNQEFYILTANLPLPAEGPYCQFPYLKGGLYEYKVYIIPDKKWIVRVSR